MRKISNTNFRIHDRFTLTPNSYRGRKMKNTVIVFLFALACLTAVPDDNLIKNPDFKVSVGKQNPDNWSVWSVGKAEVTTANVPDGKTAMRTAVGYKEKSREYYRGSLSQAIGKLVPGEYELSLNFRGELEAVFVMLRDNAGTAKTDFILRSWIPRQKFVPAANAPGWFKFYSKITVPKEIPDALFIFQGEDKKSSSFEITGIQLYQTN